MGIGRKTIAMLITNIHYKKVCWVYLIGLRTTTIVEEEAGEDCPAGI
jgi:hypothetical protein